MTLIPITNDTTAYDIWALINDILDPPMCRFCAKEFDAEAPVEDSRYPGFSHARCLSTYLEGAT